MSIKRKSAYLLASQVSSLLFGVFSSVIVARALGPEARGAFVMSNLVVQLALTLGTLGIGSAVTYRIAKALDLPAEVVGGGLVWAVILGLPIALTVGLLGPVLSEGILRGLNAQQIWIAASGIPAAYAGFFASNTLIGANHVESVAIVQGGMGLVNLLMPALVLIVLGGGVQEMIIGSAVVWLLSAIWFTAYAASKLGIRLRVRRGFFRDTLKYGLAAYLGTVSNQVWMRADTLILNALAGPGAVGQYSLSVSLAERIWIVDSSVAQAVYPSIVARGHDAAVELIGRTCRIVTLATGTIALALGLLSGWLIPFMYGQEYYPAVVSLILLLPGMVALALARIVAGYFSGQLGKPGISTIVSVAVMALGLALYALLIPSYGAAGAALGSSIAYVATLVIYLVLFWRATALPPWRLLVADRSDTALLCFTVRNAVDRVRRRQEAG